MTTPSEAAAFLRRYGATPAEANAVLMQELDAFETVFDLYAERWTQKPRPNAWCPAEVTEHVMKVNASGSKILHMMRRDAPLPELPKVEGEMRDGKRVAPDTTAPGEPQPAEALRAQWSSVRERLLSEVAATQNWQDDTRKFHHPFLGDLNALEWVQMLNYHMRHHRKGLEETFGA